MNKVSVIPELIEQRRLSPEREVKLRVPGELPTAPKVACILDEFSFASYSPQGRFAHLTMEDWEADLEEHQPDLLMVESAWRGFEGSWWNTVQRFGPELQGIVQWCRNRDIPTVFWNKEDPVHFSTFLRTASEFDYVFTTDVDCVPKYRAELGHDRVFFLPFAAQTTVHNPLDEFDRVEGCSFAGAYYAKYPDRNRDFNALAPILGQLGRFDIYDRNYWEKTPEQEFPQGLRDNIVGTLVPQDISVAYKGYEFSLNLNSVKHSQSMFARRVFELLASNTLVVSNYSRGLANMFGDLTLLSDGPFEVTERLEKLQSQPNGIQRLRRMALRKSLREHTYHQRFAQVCRAAGVEEGYSTFATDVACIGFVDSVDQAREILGSFSKQRHADKRLYLVAGKDLSADIARWVEASYPTLAGDVEIASTRYSLQYALEGAEPTFYALLSSENYYGPEFLGDMVDQFLWADEAFVGIPGTVSDVDSGQAWGFAAAIPASQGVGRFGYVGAEFVSTLNSYATQPGLGVACFQFVPGIGKLSSDEAQLAVSRVSDLDVDTGRSLEFMNAFAEGLDPRLEVEALDRSSAIPMAQIVPAIASSKVASADLNDDGAVTVRSDLQPGKHTYLYAKPVKRGTFLKSSKAEVYLEASLGLDVSLALLYFDADGERLGHSMVYPNRNTQVTIPKEAVTVRPGLRILGPGTCTLRAFFPKPRSVAVHPPIERQKVLLVTNRYPSYESIYQNGFIHSRVARYRQQGIGVEIFCVDETATSIGYREYRGIEVITGTPAMLESFIAHGSYKKLLVHFLSSAMWEVLQQAPRTLPITVWVHGFEAQPWWRRKCAFNTERELERGKEQSAQRMAMWTNVLDSKMPNLTLVFVSEWLAEGFFGDLGFDKNDFRVEVIHNVIDTDAYPYREKDPATRFKVLSIRPYASRIYANDVSVEAVLELSKDPETFDEFEFTFVGDGPLFEDTLAPIAEMDNVRIERRFLTTEEIREMHAENGVFLAPSRMDTQGVSRGEAMASGLVPVVSAVAAVPEFVDPRCAMMTAPEDARGIASALRYLARNPERFERLSKAAAERVAAELDAAHTTDQEIALIAD